jgi:Bacterial PH domain
VPFVLIGLYLIAGRFFADAQLRSKTYYGLTTERVVIVGGLFSRTTKSLQLRTLSDVSLSESSGGLGTITFGPVAPWWAGSAGWPSYRRQLSPSFDSIAAARDVYEKIRVAQKQA